MHVAQVHVPYSYGWSIIALTALVKLVTLPLTKTQVRTRNLCPAFLPKPYLQTPAQYFRLAIQYLV